MTRDMVGETSHPEVAIERYEYIYPDLPLLASVLSLPEIVIKRYENKYLIPESLCDEIRRNISFFCVPDPQSVDGKGFYQIHSLYFDTPTLSFFRDNKNRVPVRIKPRVRYFGDKPVDFVWLEVKRRVKNIVWKKRQRISLELWPDILTLSTPPKDPIEYVDNEPSIEHSLDSFLDVINAYGAIPIAHVRYLREAYVSEIDNYVRITFDRRLCGCLAHSRTDLSIDEHELLWTDDPATCDFSNSPVILEIKCEVIFPRWVADLIQKFHLVRQGFSKYCNTIEIAHAELFGNHDVRVSRFR